MNIITKAIDLFVEYWQTYKYCRLKKKILTPQLKMKLSEVPIKKITKDQKLECKKTWGHLRVYYKWIGFYNQFHETFDSRMIPDNVYYSYIDSWCNNRIAAHALDDKNIYDSLFSDIRQPLTLIRKKDGVLYDKAFNVVTLEDIKRICQSYKKIIIKPSVCSEGGHGIKLWRTEDGISLLFNYLDGMKNAICQEVIEQHKELSALHCESLNTVRIVTWTYKGVVTPLSAIVRMGVGDNFVDNASSGGIFCGITEDGRLKDVAYNTNGKKYSKHPQGAIFSEHFVPNFDECIDAVKRLAPRLSNISKLLSWDFAIGIDGHPVFIEVNMCYGELDFHQIANGPLFGSLTDEILEQVFNVRKYRIYQKFI